ncbi:MAG: BrnT family toxin [Methylococcales bacterium]
MDYHFEWDPVKAKSNLQKHGVSFEEAAEVFLDPLQLSLPDNQTVSSEERWITLGNTKSNKLQLVVHTFMTYHEDQITIRIISARPATRHEQKHYEDS